MHTQLEITYDDVIDSGTQALYMYMQVCYTYDDVVDSLCVIVLDWLVEEEQRHRVEDGNQRHEQLEQPGGK